MSGIQCSGCHAATEFIDGKTVCYCANCYNALRSERGRLREENEKYLSEINSLANIIIDATKGYVSSNDLDRANDAIDLWLSKQGDDNDD